MTELLARPTSSPRLRHHLQGIRHVVWDWNGTLFNDFSAVLIATNVSFALAGFEAVDADRYRANYVRPIPRFYARLVGRALTADEWLLIDDSFHEAYAREAEGCGLADHVAAALRALRRAGLSQSLLSMYRHEQLLPAVSAAGIEEHFDYVQGLVGGERGGSKAPHLEAHLAALGVNPSAACLIGDSLDDAAAAASLGARCVLYDGGWHLRADLDATGLPVIGSFSELAADLAPE